MATLKPNQLEVLKFLAEVGDQELSITQIADGIASLARSTVYVTVPRLQAMGLLTARWGRRGGKRVRLVRLNARGEQAIGEHEAARTIAARQLAMRPAAT